MAILPTSDPFKIISLTYPSPELDKSPKIQVGLFTILLPISPYIMRDVLRDGAATRGVLSSKASFFKLVSRSADSLMGSVSRPTDRLAKSPKRKKLWISMGDKYFIVRQRRRQMTLKVEARPQKECCLEARGAEGPRSRIIARRLDLGASPPLNGLIAPHLRPTPEDAVLSTLVDGSRPTAFARLVANLNLEVAMSA